MKENKWHPYKSGEETYFSWWLSELQGAGYVKEWFYEPENTVILKAHEYTYEKHLKSRVDYMTGCLVKQHIFTPDFKIVWDISAKDIFYQFFSAGYFDDFKKQDKSLITAQLEYSKYVSRVDTKGTFDRNKNNTLFSIKQTCLWWSHGIYCQKIVPEKQFEQTFTPARYLLTDKTMTKRKLHYEPRTLTEYIEGMK